MVLRIYSEKRHRECTYIVPDDVVGAAECYFSDVCLYLSFVKCILCSGWNDLRKINNSFIASVMQTNINEAGEFITGIPVFYFIVSLVIAAFTFWFWRKREKATGDLSFCCSLSYCQ